MGFVEINQASILLSKMSPTEAKQKSPGCPQAGDINGTSIPRINYYSVANYY